MHQQLINRAKRVIPGGVNSPVRSFSGVGGTPIFMDYAKGSKMYDVNGKEYVDFINSWGPMILGHNDERVINAIKEQCAKALTFGTPTTLEIELAELVTSIVPNIEMIRLVSSGTEACMSALRLARGYTGKNKFVKLEGHYHGHADPFLAGAGSGVATFGIQSVPGVSASVSKETIIAPFNNLAVIEELFTTYKDELAAIILEPVAGNMGCIPPKEGYLEGLRTLCDQHGVLLILDEVMTGFRLAPGGAQERFNIQADLVTYGKIIGGGMPVGAFGGRKEIMEHLAPTGNVYQAGTLSGNPLAVTAGLTTLSILNDNRHIYDDLEKTGKKLKDSISSALEEKNIPFTINQLGSMLSVHFGEHEVIDFTTSKSTNQDRFKLFFHHLLDQGIYLPPSAFESWFISHQIDDSDIEKTIAAIKSFDIHG